MNEPQAVDGDIKWFVRFALLALCITMGWVVFRARQSGPRDLHATARHPAGHVHRLAPFALVERCGRTVTEAELQGRLVVVSFVFTACALESRMITRRMAAIQDRLAGRDDVRLVSLTVDPRTDTPEVLSDFARSFNADAQRWLFLTGGKNEVFRLICESFLEPEECQRVMPGQPRSDAAQHELLVTRIMILDAQGVLRATFNGLRDSTPSEALIALEKIRAAAAPL